MARWDLSKSSRNMVYISNALKITVHVVLEVRKQWVGWILQAISWAGLFAVPAVLQDGSSSPLFPPHCLSSSKSGLSGAFSSYPGCQGLPSLLSSFLPFFFFSLLSLSLSRKEAWHWQPMPAVEMALWGQQAPPPHIIFDITSRSLACVSYLHP